MNHNICNEIKSITVREGPTSEQHKAQLREQLENQKTGTMPKQTHKEAAESNLGVETAEVHGQL